MDTNSPRAACMVTPFSAFTSISPTRVRLEQALHPDDGRHVDPWASATAPGCRVRSPSAPCLLAARAAPALGSVAFALNGDGHPDAPRGPCNGLRQTSSTLMLHVWLLIAQSLGRILLHGLHCRHHSAQQRTHNGDRACDRPPDVNRLLHQRRRHRMQASATASRTSSQSRRQSR